MLKLGRELKELETVQDELEKKEQELRAERNTVTSQDFFLIFNREQTSGSKLTLDGTFLRGQEVEGTRFENPGLILSFFLFLQLAQERSELEKLREKVKTLQDKIKQLKQKPVEDGDEGTGAEKPVVEEVIKEDRVCLSTLSLEAMVLYYLYWLL